MKTSLPSFRSLFERSRRGNLLLGLGGQQVAPSALSPSPLVLPLTALPLSHSQSLSDLFFFLSGAPPVLIFLFQDFNGHPPPSHPPPPTSSSSFCGGCAAKASLLHHISVGHADDGGGGGGGGDAIIILKHWRRGLGGETTDPRRILCRVAGIGFVSERRLIPG